MCASAVKYVWLAPYMLRVAAETPEAGRAYGRSAHGALLRVVRDVADRTAIEIVRAVPPQRWAAAQKTAGPTPTR